MHPEILTADPAEIIRYEQAFYQAFQNATHNRLARRLWQWDDDARRISTPIPYEEQIIYLQHDANREITSAVAVNVGKRDFQANAFGFAPEAGQDQWCEILTFFAVRDKSLALRNHLIGTCLHDLARRGFAAAYATSAARLVRSYLRYYGVEVIGKTKIDDEVRYFMRYALPPRQQRAA